MINYGEFSIDKCPERTEKYPKVIRIAFHKENAGEAMAYCSQIKDKGYDVFVQPMVTLNYSDRELLDLIDDINQLKPSVAYIVDSFGSMRKQDVRHIASTFDHNMIPEIPLGFHAHNSLQLAFSNALEFIDIVQSRPCYIDTSIFGIGRGAGNLCSELLTQYLNENMNASYQIEPLLEIMDEYLMPLYLRHPWGYSAAYYLSAIKRCHPNYATYLMSKQSLTISSIEKCLEKIPNPKRSHFDKNLIESIYENYQTMVIDDSKARDYLRNWIGSRNVLLIGPGKSTTTEREMIIKYIKNADPVVISVNYLPKIPVDMLFISNRKRYTYFDQLPRTTTIFTSNILERPEGSITLNYADLLNSSEVVSDNAGLMLLKFCKDIGVKKVVLAGFDGYVEDPFENYCDERLLLANLSPEDCHLRNKEIHEKINDLRKDIAIEFITDTRYEHKENEIEIA